MFFEKRLQLYLDEKEGEAIASITNIVFQHSFLHWNSLLIQSQIWIGSLPTALKSKPSKVQNRQICVTVLKNNVNRPPYIQIRVFTAKENEVLKQFVYF